MLQSSIAKAGVGHHQVDCSSTWDWGVLGIQYFQVLREGQPSSAQDGWPLYDHGKTLLTGTPLPRRVCSNWIWKRALSGEKKSEKSGRRLNLCTHCLSMRSNFFCHPLTKIPPFSPPDFSLCCTFTRRVCGEGVAQPDGPSASYCWKWSLISFPGYRKTCNLGKETSINDYIMACSCQWLRTDN